MSHKPTSSDAHAEAGAAAGAPPAARPPRHVSLPSEPASWPARSAPQAPIVGPAGTFRFVLLAEMAGVHVVRVFRRDDGADVHCSAIFEDEPAFQSWLDADTLRFSHPLVFQQARRCFSELLAQGSAHVRTGR